MIYNNLVHRKSWEPSSEAHRRMSKPRFHPKKIMFSMWWDFKGFTDYEQLLSGQTIDSALYCS